MLSAIFIIRAKFEYTARKIVRTIILDCNTGKYRQQLSERQPRRSTMGNGARKYCTVSGIQGISLFTPIVSTNVLSDIYFRTSDNGYFVVGAGSDRAFAELSQLLESNEWATSDAYRTNADRVRNRIELIKLISARYLCFIYLFYYKTI